MQGCSKENPPKISSEEINSKSVLRKGSNGNDSMAFILWLSSPLRDILTYNPSYLDSIALESNSGFSAPSSGGGPDYHCCNGICLTVPTNPDPGAFYYPLDAYGNNVKFIAQYGTDPRQVYYVYIPQNVNPNSPIVIMIHGGGWYSGPSGTIKGFPFNWGDDASESMVKDLLNNGYVVVSMLYRLTKYGNNQAEIESTPITIQNQMDDIGSVISHIRTNFPSCLYGYTLNANKIHLLGESAGGHLSLMYAYKNGNPTYLRSVISMYAPTNMTQYGNYLKNIPSGSFYNCNGNFLASNFPFYFPVDLDETATEYNINPVNCPVTNTPPLDQALVTYNLLQTGVSKVISNPLTLPNKLADYSPCYAISANPIIPTFIMHGKVDQLAPYASSTNSMNTQLSTYGGLISTYFNTNSNIPTQYSNLNNKHIIKLYDFANHGWAGANKDRVRSDVIVWLNGHNF